MFWLTFQGSCNVRSFPKNYPKCSFRGRWAVALRDLKFAIISLINLHLFSSRR